MQIRDKLRWYLIGGGIFFLGFILVWLIFLSRRQVSPSTDVITPTIPVSLSGTPRPLTTGYATPEPFPESLIPTSPPTPMMGPGKQIVSGIAIKNFPAVITPFDPQGDRVLNETDTFQIVYLKPFQQFKIALLGDNFAQSRQQAEQEFLRLTEVNEPNACRLSVIEYVPNYVNNAQKELEFALSFCEHPADSDGE